MIVEEIAFFGCGHTFRDLAQKPFVIIHETLDGFLDEGWHVAALLSGKAVQFRLPFGRKLQVHEASLGRNRDSVKTFVSPLRFREVTAVSVTDFENHSA